MILVGGCVQERPPPPSRVQSALPPAQAEARAASSLESAGWMIQSQGPTSIRATTNQASLAACDKIQVQGNEGSTGRWRWAAPIAPSGAIDVTIRGEGDGSLVSWTTSFEADYHNSLKNSNLSAGCASSGTTEAALVSELGSR